MNRIQRRRIKRKADLKLLFFTFVGAFILFFAAFTYFLPILTPKVEIPALSEDYALDSITSQDFRGRIDPRLHSIELQEEIKPVAAQEEKKLAPDEQKPKEKVVKEDKPAPKPKITAPPRPKSIELREKVKIEAPVPVYRSRVVVGDFENPKEVKIASDILASLQYEPIIRELNGKYILQVASFADKDRAKELVKELKERNFEARIIYE